MGPQSEMLARVQPSATACGFGPTIAVETRWTGAVSTARQNHSPWAAIAVTSDGARSGPASEPTESGTADKAVHNGRPMRRASPGQNIVAPRGSFCASPPYLAHVVGAVSL